MPSDDRDQQLDRALARHLRGASLDAACPDAEILAAYHERSLSLEEMAHWKTHIASCSRCQETLALLEQTDSVAANDWEKNELPASLPRARGIAQKESVPARFTADTASVPVVMRDAAKAIGKTRRRMLWGIAVPAGTLAAGLLVWVAVHENSRFAKHEHASIQVAENREASPPASNGIPEYGKVKARDEGSAAFESKNVPERVPATPSATPALPVKRMPSTRFMAPPSAPQGLTKSQQDNRPHPDSSTSAYAYRAKDAEGLVGGTRTAGAAPAAPKVAAGRAGGPLVANQQQNQTQNQIAIQNSNQAVTPSANQPVGGVSEQVTVESEKHPVTEDKKDARKELKQTNETVTVGAATETVEVTSAPPSPAADTLARTPVNGKEEFLSSLQNSNIVVSRDQRHIWRIGHAGKIESSTDGGKTWRMQMSGVTADLVSGSAPSGGICWIVGKVGTVLLTTDGGKHWKQLASPISGNIGGINAVDAQNAAIWDIFNHNRFETSDGGVTWKQVANQ